MDVSALYLKIQSQLDQQLPLVIYKKPGENKVNSFLQEDAILHEVRSYETPGFVFAPFHSDEKTILIPEAKSVFLRATISIDTKKQLYFENNFSNSKEDQTSENDHIVLVQKGIDAISNNLFKKVVLSRKEEILFTEEKQPLEVFQGLIHTYLNAFVYCWYHPKVGTWLGATPETLLTVKGNNFSTMALAGTQPYVDSMKVSWGTKEIEEQAMVTEFVLEELAKKVKTIEKSKAYTYKAGSLLHLKTDITGILKNVQSNVKDIVEVLHPTPAVCGLPKKQARSFILEHESYSRKYYTGFLGELHIANENSSESNLFVNLRCMEFYNNKAILYVGGGITKDSIPEKEWEETVRKTETMRRVL
ncbi:chorismate-binding protein [Aquimarina litoralis]|uniref:chorismate-binding protein n=1 Tax=Aquimarina litoralis TaxID=584605 RepID=UPI001C5960EB|nr:chorismate-binding protein [Aquimarina litoralis]MBW1297238.1 isochorismate synthase [Aquimarina litoralis]